MGSSSTSGRVLLGCYQFPLYSEPELFIDCVQCVRVGCLLFDNDCGSSLIWCGSIGFEPRPSNVDREMG